MERRWWVLVGVTLALVPAHVEDSRAATACAVFPTNNVWHADITRLPIHPRSDAWLASMDAASRTLHPDFGPSGGPMPYGIPFGEVSASHPMTSIDFQYEDESDPGPYPFDADTPIELGSDRHALMLADDCMLYELFDADHNGGAPTAGSGAVFDLASNDLRPYGWTSADAAGLPIYPGLVRRAEVDAGHIDHAIRVTASLTRRSFVWPARHHAGATDDPDVPPMGARFRLKASYPLAGLRDDTKTILRAMKTHGLILADNGSDWFFTGAAEDGWPDAMLDELKSVPASAFEAVKTAPMKLRPGSGAVKTRIRIVRIVVDPPGPDVDGEFIVLKNRGTNPSDISGWTIRDTDGNAYTFGPTVLAPRGKVRLHTGSGSDTPKHRYWGKATHVWDNEGDGARLFNVKGRQHDRCTYAAGVADMTC